VKTKRRQRLAVSVVAFLAFIATVNQCNRLPPLAGRTISVAATDTASTRLGKAITPLLAAHPRLSGVYALRDARDAFAARYLLAAAAERTLDVQYYIWRHDLSGTLLMKALVAAADRGVRVRLLLDDNNTGGLDELLAAVDSHPRVEVRLFNPFAVRKPRAIGYLTDFPRLNRRMHNKSFTADNRATIIGGRNVGDEYFGATDGVLFADLDVLAIGPVVAEVSTDFDRYWASDSAYPADRLLPIVDKANIARISAEAARVERDAAAVMYLKAVQQTAVVRQLREKTLPFEWAVTRMISDPPAKALRRAGSEELLFHQFETIFGTPAAEVDLVSPYFVPGRTGVELFGGWSKRGVRVRVLTNSFEATDVALVHAGYAKRRKRLLAAGVALYELRATAGSRPAASRGMFGSSGSSLHAKTFAVDRSRLFIGSFNFDPRSAELNTEMGFVIDSPVMARRLAEVFDKDVPTGAWEVRLSKAGDVEWLEHRGGSLVRHPTEPGTTSWQRMAVFLLSGLPIDPLL
jgi:putative cardiolipin synthase